MSIYKTISSKDMLYQDMSGDANINTDMTLRPIFQIYMKTIVTM